MVFKNKSKSVNGYIDSYWNGITTLELSKIIFEIIESDKYIPGVQHFYSENTLSKYDIIKYIKEINTMNIDINPISNGIKYYTLNSIINKPRKNIYDQLNELFSIYNEYLMSIK